MRGGRAFASIPPLMKMQQLTFGRRGFLSIVTPILDIYGFQHWSISHVCQSFSAPVLQPSDASSQHATLTQHLKVNCQRQGGYWNTSFSYTFYTRKNQSQRLGRSSRHEMTLSLLEIFMVKIRKYRYVRVSLPSNQVYNKQ